MLKRIPTALLCILFVSFPSLLAQSISGSIVGSVVDSSQGAIVGATVTLVQAATGSRRSTETDTKGDFVFGTLASGEYSLVVEFTGFKTLKKEGINLPAAERLPVGKLVLELGDIKESVTVMAQGAVVQTASAERSGTITSSQVDQVAIRGRNVMDLLQLRPGVVSSTGGDSLGRGWTLNVNGNRQATTAVSLDGLTMNAIGNNNNMMMMVSQDAIAEVKVLLSNFQAEYGRMSGANVHLVSKSGTRDFHGGVSYYKRHEQFNANNFFNNRLGQIKPRYRFNTFNYNVGGPVTIPQLFNKGRDKLFFFWSQEFWPMKSSTGLQTLTVPTADERKGDFSKTVDLNNKLIAITDPLTGKQFPGNVIPDTRLNASGKALLGVFPQPNFLDRTLSSGRYNYVYEGENSNPKRTSTLKVDYEINANNMLSANFTEHSDVSQGPFVGHNIRFDVIRQERRTPGKAIIVNYKKIFSPTLINEFNIGFTDRPETENSQKPLTPLQRDAAGFKVSQFNPSANPLNLLPASTFGGITNAAAIGYDGRFPLNTTHKILTAIDNVTYTRSSHTFKFGFYYDFFWRGASDNTIIPFGSFSFATDVNNPQNTGYAYSNAILGIFQQYTETTQRPFAQWRLSNVEWYAQDTWRVSRRLTLDYGMRFAVVRPIYETENRVTSFIPNRWSASSMVKLIKPAMVGGKRVGVHPVTGEVYPASVIGYVAPNTGNAANGMASPMSDSSVPRGLVASQGVQYGPRAGFAWDFFGNGKMALRGGFGIFYNRQNLDAQILGNAFQIPLVSNPVINYGTFDTFLNASGLTAPQNILGVDPLAKIPTVYNWSLTLQRDIGYGTVVDVGYVGSGGRHLLWQRELNVIPAGANFNPANMDPTTGRVLASQFLMPYQGYSSVIYREWASSSNYHSLQLSANRRFAKGAQFGLAWTWSKSMDFNSGDQTTVSPIVPLRVWNYGLSDHDRTHMVKFNWLWDIPRVNMPHAVLDRILNGWQISGIASFISGSPIGIGYSTTTSIDITGTSTQGARVVVAGKPVLPKGDRTFSRYFDTGVYKLPAVGTFGNAARSQIRGPGINNWDIAIFKNVTLREQMRIQYRFEAYNAFNHTQFSGLDTTARFDSTTGAQVNTRFGELTAARDPRIIQMSLRFLF